MCMEKRANCKEHPRLYHAISSCSGGVMPCGKDTLLVNEKPSNQK